MAVRLLSDAAPWRYEIRFHWPSGRLYRERRRATVTGKSAAVREAEKREAYLLAAGEVALVPVVPAKKVPTVGEFWPRYLSHCRGEREKPSSLAGKASVWRTHLAQRFASVPLNEVSASSVSALRTALANRSPKTVNNVLSPLNSCLKLAAEWEEIPTMPCRIKISAVHGERPDFYDFDDYARLVDAARELGAAHDVLVRLGGEAGLRRGEMMALRQTDVDYRRKQLRVEQAGWTRSKRKARAEGVGQIEIGKPKGGRGRVVPMTDALCAALTAHRHRGEYVLANTDGAMTLGHVLRDNLERVQKCAGMTVMGSLHKLRHTFCSHLAMRGAPAKAIQELAGHTSLATTLRYMHLSPSALDEAIGLLNVRAEGSPGARVDAEP